MPLNCQAPGNESKKFLKQGVCLSQQAPKLNKSPQKKGKKKDLDQGLTLKSHAHGPPTPPHHRPLTFIHEGVLLSKSANSKTVSECPSRPKNDQVYSKVSQGLPP